MITNSARGIATLDPKSEFGGRVVELDPENVSHQQKYWANKKKQSENIFITSNTEYKIDWRIRRIPRRKRRHINFVELTPPDEDLLDESWRITGGAIVQRSPVVMKEDKPWETEWKDWILEQDKRWGVHLDDWYYEQGTLPDAHKIWRPAAVETKEDKLGNRRTTNRRLTDDLFLIVKKPREEHPWCFPQGGNLGDESLQRTVNRELMEQLGEGVVVSILGNHPHGYLKYKYPKDFNKYKRFRGSKLFLYRALYIKGQVSIDPDADIDDFAWVARDELHEYLSPNVLELALGMLPVPACWTDVEYKEP